MQVCPGMVSRADRGVVFRRLPDLFLQGTHLVRCVWSASLCSMPYGSAWGEVLWRCEVGIAYRDTSTPRCHACPVCCYCFPFLNSFLCQFGGSDHRRQKWRTRLYPFSIIFKAGSFVQVRNGTMALPLKAPSKKSRIIFGGMTPTIIVNSHVHRCVVPQATAVLWEWTSSALMALKMRHRWSVLCRVCFKKESGTFVWSTSELGQMQLWWPSMKLLGSTVEHLYKSQAYSLTLQAPCFINGWSWNVCIAQCSHALPVAMSGLWFLYLYILCSVSVWRKHSISVCFELFGVRVSSVSTEIPGPRRWQDCEHEM